MFMDYRDIEIEDFILDGMQLRIEVKEIYFIIGISPWGEVVNLWAHGVGVGLTIEVYLDVYFLPNIEKIESHVLVNAI